MAPPLQVADPPLLRLETEAGHAYLSVLLHLTSTPGSGSDPGEEEGEREGEGRFPAAADAVPRLLLCMPCPLPLPFLPLNQHNLPTFHHPHIDR